MRRDHFGRKLRPTKEEVREMAERAAAKAAPRAQPVEPAPPPVEPVPDAMPAKNKGGRPATGRDPHISLRVPGEWKEALAQLPPGKRAEFLRAALKPAVEKLISQQSEKQSRESLFGVRLVPPRHDN